MCCSQEPQDDRKSTEDSSSSSRVAASLKRPLLAGSDRHPLGKRKWEAEMRLAAGVADLGGFRALKLRASGPQIP